MTFIYGMLGGGALVLLIIWLMIMTTRTYH